jgi:Ca2+-binding RTX toxin-like protein
LVPKLYPRIQLAYARVCHVSFVSFLPIFALIIWINNIDPSYAEVSTATRSLQELINSLPESTDIDTTTDPAPTTKDNTNTIDSGRTNNLQFCKTKNTNMESTESQKGSARCILPNENEISASYLSGNSLIFCRTGLVLPLPCVGTENDDIIYGARTTEEIFALGGNDMVFANAADTRMFGGNDDDLIVAGPGNDLVDGGPNDDVLLAGAGSDLLIGGTGNDKLFNGAGTAVMYGGKGANHFDCSLSALGLARSVVMDYNPANGDTISGPCKIVNTIGDSNDIPKQLPQKTLPDTGETSSSNNEVIAGSLIGN